MVSSPEERDSARLLIARLESRVAALEEALERRSHELRLLQRHLCSRDLAIVARIDAGLPAVPSGPFDVELWEESTLLEPADVPETLRRLWDSIAIDHCRAFDQDVDSSS